jgi:hypothetical protein
MYKSFSTHDAFLEQPSSGTLKVKGLESQIIKNFCEQEYQRA